MVPLKGPKRPQTPQWPLVTSLGSRIRGLVTGVPVAENEKTYHFKELYTETIIRNPKTVGLFGYS